MDQHVNAGIWEKQKLDRMYRIYRIHFLSFRMKLRKKNIQGQNTPIDRIYRILRAFFQNVFLSFFWKDR